MNTLPFVSDVIMALSMPVPFNAVNYSKFKKQYK
jgi:hypothetical protein